MFSFRCVYVARGAQNGAAEWEPERRARAGGREKGGGGEEAKFERMVRFHVRSAAAAAADTHKHGAPSPGQERETAMHSYTNNSTGETAVFGRVQTTAPRTTTFLPSVERGAGATARKCQRAK